jgi:hypothetical protein
MTINQELLKKAVAAGERLSAAERQVQSARAEYHAIIRRMHLAGSSLREMAQALDLSHQRIQQMVDGAGGSWWQKVWRSRNLRENLACTFCERSQDHVAKLIAGPKVFICETCVAFAEQSLGGRSAGSAHGSLVVAREDTKGKCSFCGKRRTSDRQLLTGPAASVCSECLDVCRQILIDSTP